MISIYFKTQKSKVKTQNFGIADAISKAQNAKRKSQNFGIASQ
jgi:hypothetical protein